MPNGEPDILILSQHAKRAAGTRKASRARLSGCANLSQSTHDKPVQRRRACVLPQQYSE